MFERLQKPFLTVETGEAYQPIRIVYDLLQRDAFIEALSKLKCIENKQTNGWNIFWRNECDDIHFESLDSFKKNPKNPTRLGTFLLKEKALYLNLPSFKRACLLVPFLHKLIDPSIIKIKKADFINKVFGLNERLPHGFSELFDEDELEKIVHQRIHDYETVQERCEQAETADAAFKILSEYTNTESRKRLPYAERYTFQEISKIEPDVAYLGFYIFLRGRELVAIRRWFGETGYTLADAAEETIEQVFGGMHIDIIE
ncbi:MAG: hypothetical protein KIT56_05860 [Gammaproteobacteria bacterium]|nr:hypothetical protein [Gammaproteobacteria bacterium]MCW5583394.1 hypothetical protein [Gammaproteobacteria bacterium]